MSERLVSRVAAVLERLGAPYAIVGAGALAVHGVARSTFDVDLLTTSVIVLERDAWAEVSGMPGTRVAVRRGDAEDPLAGVVRIEAEGERDVDVVVGRLSWQSEAIARARRVSVAGAMLPVVLPADLVLLKLYAGGSQDAWDIEQLLAGPDRDQLVRQVDSRLDSLPPRAARLWAGITSPDDSA